MSLRLDVSPLSQRLDEIAAAQVSILSGQEEIKAMVTSLELSLGVSSVPASGGQTYTANVTQFTVPDDLFDDGLSIGQTEAPVPVQVSTDAPDGTPVYGRYVTVDGGGGVLATSASQALGTTSGGAFFGSIDIPANTATADWYLREIQVGGTGGSWARDTARFGVGTVIANWAQSEVHEMLKSAHSNTTTPAVVDDNALMIVAPNDTTRAPEIQYVTNANPRTDSLAAMSNAFAQNCPGRKFKVVFNVLSGTGWRALVEDANTSRSWADDKAIHDAAFANGSGPGIAMASWFASPRGLGSDYEDALFPILFGKLSDGTVIPELAGGTPASTYTHNYGSGQSLDIDHTFEEIYDYSRTKWLGYGPHKFSPPPGGNLQNAVTLVGGAEATDVVNIERCRLSWRDMIANPHGHFLSTPGLEPLNYLNGEDDGAGGWNDTSHPADDNADGSRQLAVLTALAAMQGLDLVSWSVPAFTNADWQEDGSYFEVESSAGPITTTRQARALPALPNTYAHWADVTGFEINSVPAERTEIVAGRVRVYRNTAADPFIAADVITFGKGGASGMLLNPEDYQNDLWMNWPIVDVGATGIDGISVSAMPDAAVLANPLVDPSVPSSFAALDMSGASANLAAFRSQSTIAAANEMTIESWVRASSSSGGFSTIHGLSDQYFDIRFFGTGGGLLRVNLRTAGGTFVYNNHTVSGVTLPLDQWVRLVTAVDMVAGNLAIFVDGTELATLSFTPPGSGLPSNRHAEIIRGSGGSPSGLVDIGSYRHWLTTAATLGDIPATAADVDIPEGTDWAAHAWRTAHGVLT